MVEFAKYSTSWQIILELMNGSVVISEINSLMYVVLSRLQKHVPYGELVDTTEHITLQPRCCANRGRYNRIKL
jgi:hypothetical protein